MSNLTVVGHFSTLLLLAWVVWIAWLAGQMLWYRRLTAASDRPETIVSQDPGPEAAPEPKPERSVPLRAPGAALRSMTTASTTTRPAPQPDAATPPDGPAAAAPPADEPTKEPGSEIKPFE